MELWRKILTKHTKIAIFKILQNSSETEDNSNNGIDSEEASKEMIKSALIID